MTTGGEKPARVVPAPLLVVACLGGGWLAHRLRPVRFLPDLGGFGAAAGAAIVLAALAIGLAGVREFHRQGTPTSPFRASTALVKSGVFRFTRNPMYLGLVLVGIGAAVAFNSAALLAASALLALLLQVAVIRPEERILSTRYGAAFEKYRLETRRWI